jgi:dipeptidyl aminopeptidase/acylaminoacyl peptidase
VENDSARRKLGWVPPQAFAFPGRDGKTLIYGIVYLPYANAVQGQSPILEDIYAGPPGTHCPKNYHFAHNLEQLRAMGFAVVVIDGMGTNWRSKAFHDVCWRNLKDAGLPDRILWIRQMAKKFPSLDPTRVGIYGGSAGGQNAAGALIFHPEFYSAAFADCGCHDNRMDKIWWNEAWMGWPVGPWYSESSNIDQAARLQGSLFLTGGECDTNVDPLSTSKFAEALRQAGKPFDYTMLPGGTHCVGGWAEIAPRWKAFFIKKLLLGGSDEEIAKFRNSRATLVKNLAPLPVPAPALAALVAAAPVLPSASSSSREHHLVIAVAFGLMLALIALIFLLSRKLKPAAKSPTGKSRTSRS